MIISEVIRNCPPTEAKRRWGNWVRVGGNGLFLIHGCSEIVETCGNEICINYYVLRQLLFFIHNYVRGSNTKSLLPKFQSAFTRLIDLNQKSAETNTIRITIDYYKVPLLYIRALVNQNYR